MPDLHIAPQFPTEKVAELPGCQIFFLTQACVVWYKYMFGGLSRFAGSELLLWILAFRRAGVFMVPGQPPERFGRGNVVGVRQCFQPKIVAFQLAAYAQFLRGGEVRASSETVFFRQAKDLAKIPCCLSESCLLRALPKETYMSVVNDECFGV